MDVLRGFSVFCFLFLLLSLTAADPALSQPPGGQQGFGQEQGQQSDQMENMITQLLKQMLGSTDEEWTVIGPKALKVYSLVSSQSTGVDIRSMMGRTGNQGSQMRGNNRSSSTSTEDVALEELQTLLDSEETTITQLKNKISEIRNSREKSRQDLVKARKELRELLTLRQEATLITLGLLE